MVICLEQGADLHMAQLMPLPLTVSCFSKIQIGFTFLVPAHLGSPGQRAVKRVWVCYRCVECLQKHAQPLARHTDAVALTKKLLSVVMYVCLSLQFAYNLWYFFYYHFFQ